MVFTVNMHTSKIRDWTSFLAKEDGDLSTSYQLRLLHVQGKLPIFGNCNEISRRLALENPL